MRWRDAAAARVVRGPRGPGRSILVQGNKSTPLQGLIGAPLLLLLLMILPVPASAAGLPRTSPAARSEDDQVPPPPPSLNSGRRWEEGASEETIVLPRVYAGCCGQATDSRCSRACLAALDAPALTLARLLDELHGEGCPLLPYDPLFLCLVSRASQDSATGSSGSLDQGVVQGPGVVLDAARLHCCALARSSPCRRACQRAYRDDWGAAGRGGPLQDCLGLGKEPALASCLAEVDAPCRPASHCRDSLDFCADVLGVRGPLGAPSWFRTCSSLADAAARRTATRWRAEGWLPLSGAEDPVVAARNASEPTEGVPLVTGSDACGPQLWRALACVLHAQPCTPSAGTLPICLQDCLLLLPRCVRWSAVPAGFSAEKLCARMAGPPPCVSLPTDDHLDLLQDPDEGRPAKAPETAPVPEQPAQEVPRANRCVLGAASDVEVPVGTAVRVPSRDGGACYQACLCGVDESGARTSTGTALGTASLRDCTPLPCAPYSSVCRLGANTIEHRRTVVMDCLVCSCAAGETLCTQRASCPLSRVGVVGVQGISTPCQCSPHLVPVCGRNGRSYDNACLARCAGLSDADLHPGPCPLRDPCAVGDVPVCPGQRRCVPDRRVCLSTLVRPCPQFQCVDCKDSQPVCDTQGRTHPSACALQSAGREALHPGPCVRSAPSSRDPPGPVCGADGFTYPSARAARYALVPVDHAGACSAGVPGVSCPPLPRGCERGVRVGRCEACAGVLHAALNTKAVDKAVLAAGSLPNPWPRPQDTFSLRALLQELQQQVLEQCTVLGFLSGSEQLVVVLEAAAEAEAADAVHRCYLEAQRLAGLFEQSAARVQASVLLAAVQAVDLQPAPATVHDQGGGGRGGAAPDAAPAGTAPAVTTLLMLLLALHCIARL